VKDFLSAGEIELAKLNFDAAKTFFKVAFYWIIAKYQMFDLRA